MAQASMLALGKADGLDYEQSKTVQASLLPTKRISDPSEVAALVYWLTSGEQRSIVGQSLDINNGSSMQ
jgi:NAD(P)-dependent dehydrogenase (short-subunit alcohol dehydrogenase family)